MELLEHNKIWAESPFNPAYFSCLLSRPETLLCLWRSFRVSQTGQVLTDGRFSRADTAVRSSADGCPYLFARLQVALYWSCGACVVLMWAGGRRVSCFCRHVVSHVVLPPLQIGRTSDSSHQVSPCRRQCLYCSSVICASCCCCLEENAQSG